jgi:hypothetical protein
MRSILLTIIGFAVATAAFAMTSKPPVDVDIQVKERVNHFFDQVAKGKASENESMFLKPDVSVNGFGYGRGDERPYFQMKPAEFLKRHGNLPKYFVVNGVQVDRVHDRLAVARVDWKAGGMRGNSVITWVNDGKTWQIVTFFQDEHFVW